MKTAPLVAELFYKRRRGMLFHFVAFLRLINLMVVKEHEPRYLFGNVNICGRSGHSSGLECVLNDIVQCHEAVHGSAFPVRQHRFQLCDDSFC